MKHLIQENRAELARLFNVIEVSNNAGISFSFEEGVEQTINLINQMQVSKGKLVWIGNGGSAAIASHMATDFLKNLGIAAMAFNDGALLTCLSNDLGYDKVFSTPINKLMTSSDVLVAISSSGKSQNILNAVQAAQALDIKIITLSGFDDNNPLREMGDVNFYVPSDHYGHVEDIHHSIIHCWIDIIMQQSNVTQERVGAHE